MTFDALAKRETWRSVAAFFAFVHRRFKADGALDMASSLSYTSLLSLVPLMAIALAMLAAFPVFDDTRQQLQDTLFRNFVPEVGGQVQGYVSSFVGNAGRLTAAGIIGLAFTAVMLLVAIETSFNRIFRVAQSRAAASRVLLYWTALTLGPLLIGTSFSLSAWIFAARHFADTMGLSWLTGPVAAMVPNLLLVLSFGLLYLAVPNRRVAPLHALAGGVAATFVFALLRRGFAVYLSQTHAYQSVYGAVALVPIFLFWTYLSWAVILIGAEITAALPEWRLARLDSRQPPTGRRRLSVALAVLGTLLAGARKGPGEVTRAELLAATGDAESLFLSVLARLERLGIVVPTAKGKLVLGRDLGTVSLGEVARGLGIGFSPQDADSAAGPWLALVAGQIDAAATAEAKPLDVPLASLLGGESAVPRG